MKMKIAIINLTSPEIPTICWNKYLITLISHPATFRISRNWSNIPTFTLIMKQKSLEHFISMFVAFLLLIEIVLSRDKRSIMSNELISVTSGLTYIQEVGP